MATHLDLSTRVSGVEHVPQGQTLLVLLEDPARPGDPRLVVPHVCFGSVPPPVRGENRLHLELGKPLHDVARAPDQPTVIAVSAEIIRLQKPIEVVFGFGIVIRVHVGKKEIGRGLAGFFIRGIGIARDKDESVVAGYL